MKKLLQFFKPKCLVVARIAYRTGLDWFASRLCTCTAVAHFLCASWAFLFRILLCV